jgi:hypothetical protein
VGWIFGAIYLALPITLGVLSIRKGHWLMFRVGTILPVFWLVGALLPEGQGAEIRAGRHYASWFCLTRAHFHQRRIGRWCLDPGR